MRYRLTPTQRRIAVHMAQGCTAKQIGCKLGCSSRTVEVHRQKMMINFEALNACNLMAILIGYGYISIDEIEGKKLPPVYDRDAEEMLPSIAELRRRRKICA